MGKWKIALGKRHDRTDNDIFGKNFYNDDNLNIQSFNDVITTNNNIIIVKGDLDIKTENESMKQNDNNILLIYINIKYWR